MHGVPKIALAAFVLTFAAWIAWRLFKDWRTGRATPLRGVWDGFDRRTQPGLFWATLAGNAVVLVFVLILLASLFVETR